MSLRPPPDWSTVDEQRWRHLTAQLRLVYERVRLAEHSDTSSLAELRARYDACVEQLRQLWPEGADRLKDFDDIGETGPERRNVGYLTLLLVALIAFYGSCVFFVVLDGGWMAIGCALPMVAALVGLGLAIRRSKRSPVELRADKKTERR